MKKLSWLLALVMVMCSLSACTTSETATTQDTSSADTTEAATSVKLNIGVLKGPTGMNLAYLFGDEYANYEVSLYDSPDQVISKFMNGELDAVTVPSNTGSILYNKLEGDVSVAAVVAYNPLLIVGTNGSVTSLAELSGKTIYAAGQGSLTEYVLSSLLEAEGATDTEVVWLSSHTDVVSKIASEEGEVFAMLPEPFATMACSKSENLDKLVSLSDKWQEIHGEQIPMGVLITRRSLAEEHPEDFELLKQAALDSSTKLCEDKEAGIKLITELGITASEGVAKASINSCAVTATIDSETMHTQLESFYKMLYEINPDAIGGNLPSEDYYGVTK